MSLGYLNTSSHIYFIIYFKLYSINIVKQYHLLR